MKKILFIVLFLFATLSPMSFLHAQDNSVIQDKISVIKAKVLEITNQENKTIPGTDTKSNYQTLKAEILEGGDAGRIVTVQNDYLNLKTGETFYMMDTVSADTGVEYFSVQDPYRLPVLYFFIGLFVLCVFLFGGMQGVRGLVSLVGSFVLIVYVLMPGIIHGYSPILLSIGVSSLIIILGSYITHGFNKTTTSAVLGMITTIIFTGILAYIAVKLTHLSGFYSEESTYLNFNTRGAIDFAGLLFGGIMIGLLGVLYDVSIGQAISVEELHHVGPHLPKKAIYMRAIRIGREHIGALVNTLAIAYVGASLPLLLLFYTSTTGLPHEPIINQEIFATEIIRTVIGSIGLILAVPITTLVSVFLIMKKKEVSVDENILNREESKIDHIAHHH